MVQDVVILQYPRPPGQGVEKEGLPEGPQEDTHRREALPLQVRAFLQKPTDPVTAWNG